MQKNQRKQYGKGIKLVPVTVDGKTFMADANSIDKAAWTRHHGQTASGAQVNSALSCTIGETTLLKPSENAPALSFPSADLEVFAKQSLEKRGYNIQAKA